MTHHEREARMCSKKKLREKREGKAAMSSSPAAAPLPVGFRFRPTDEELVLHYLKPKIAGRPHPDLLLIPDVDLSACEPWDLPAKALIKSDDPEWFFFAPLDRKYPGGHRSNRSTAAGYWKATGKDRLIRSRPAGTLIGIKKTLVFHRGRAPRGRRTAWIMHEYRTTEPQLHHSQDGSFVLYRLFNKHEEETNLEDAESPSTSSPAHLKMMKSENSAHLLTSVDKNDPTAPQEKDPVLDVLAHVPSLQPDKTLDGFPTITSPMRPYTDHPFLANAEGQDLSEYLDSIIACQEMKGALSCTTGDAEMNPTAMLMPSGSSNDKVVDDTGAAHCSSGTKILQKDTCDVSHGTDVAYSASAHLSHLYHHSLLHSTSAEMEQPYIAAQFSAGSWTPYPQHLFDDVVDPYGSNMTSSDAFDGLEGLVDEPMMQQFADSNVQQGTAARRIRLVHSVQKATVTEPVLTSHLESEDEAGSSYRGSEDEAGSSYSVGNLSTIHDKDYTNLISQTVAGEATHAQDGRFLPPQVDYLVEVTEKSRNFSFDEHISSNDKLLHEANLKQRLKQENTKSSQNVRDDLPNSGRVPREPSYRRLRHAPIASVVWLLFLAIFVILAFVCLWKSS